jgi:hypothetical protein
MRTTQLIALAAVLGATTVACNGKDSGTGTPATTGGTGGGEVGPIAGSAGVFIVEAGCDIVWDMSGDQCAGCDLGWDISLGLTDAGSCSFGDNTSGKFEVSAGAAYFEGDYWGAAAAGGGAVSWATVGYVYGAGGYTYFYSGSAAY